MILEQADKLFNAFDDVSMRVKLIISSRTGPLANNFNKYTN